MTGSELTWHLMRTTVLVLAGFRFLPAADLRVSILDETGQPSPAAVRLYDSRGEPLVPDDALDLGSMGYLYAPGKLIGYADWTSPRLRSQAPYFGSNFLLPELAPAKPEPPLMRTILHFGCGFRWRKKEPPR